MHMYFSFSWLYHFNCLFRKWIAGILIRNTRKRLRWLEAGKCESSKETLDLGKKEHESSSSNAHFWGVYWYSNSSKTKGRNLLEVVKFFCLTSVLLKVTAAEALFLVPWYPCVIVLYPVITVLEGDAPYEAWPSITASNLALFYFILPFTVRH